MTLHSAHRCIDHRVFGTWNTDGAADYIHHYRAQLELAPDLAGRVDDVLALGSHAVLLLWTFFGTARDSGGAFENRLLALCTFGPDGRNTSIECFEPDQGKEAIARFIAHDRRGETLLLGATAAGSPSITARNTMATRFWDDCGAAMQAQDIAAFRELFAEDFHCESRRTATGFGLPHFLETWRVMLAASSFSCTERFTVALGDRVALQGHLLTMDGLRDPDLTSAEPGGLVELDELVVAEVDTNGMCCRMDLFDAGQMGEALACAYERFATHQPAGHQRDQALGMARLVLAQTGQLDPERVVPAVAADFRCVDRRVFGTWSVSSAAEISDYYRQQLAITKDSIGRTDEVLALGADALLIRITFYGTGRDSGGSFENQMLLLARCGADGPVNYIELIECAEAADALARFHEFASAVARETSPVRFANAATRAVERGASALAARDWDAFAALMAPGFRHFDRTRIAQIETDGQDWLASFRRMVEMTSAPPAYEVLATRGERLALMAMVWRGSDLDIGESEIEWRLIIEVNGRGEHVAIVSYDAGDVDAAYAELDARFDASEEVLNSHAWRSLRAFTALVARRDWDAVTALCTDAFEEFDHRSVATLGTTRGGDAWARNFSTLVALSPDMVYRVHHFVDRHTAYYSHGSWVGTREGGAYELVVNAVLDLDEHGRIRRADIYDGEEGDEALAWLERVVAASARQPSTQVLAQVLAQVLTQVGKRLGTVAPNAAYAAFARMVAAYRTGAETGNWAEMRAACAPDFAFADRRRMNLLEGDIEMLLAAFQERAVSGARLSITPIGSAGDRVAVIRLLLSGGPADGPFEIEYQVVFESDQSGRLCASVNLERDDTRAAQREAWRRWAAIEPGIAGIIDVVGLGVDAFNAQDARAFRALCADELRYHDARRTGIGVIEGADAAIASIEVYWKLAGMQQVELGWQWPAYGRHAVLTVVRRFGTLRDGGEFESEYLEIFAARDGRFTHLELYELDDLERAVARTAELNAGEDA